MFYLYQCKEFDNHLLYDSDIYNVFKNNKLRVYDISKSKYCITCIRNSNKNYINNPNQKTFIKKYHQY